MVEEKDENVSLVVSVVATIGLACTTPAVLSDRGNLIIHLAPYPVVARVASALFRGLQEPALRCFVGNATDPREFWMALTARTLMSVLGNLDFALAGNGDLDYALRQLKLAGYSLEQIRDTT